MKKQTCEYSRENMVAYADGELLPNEAVEVSGHIVECESCRLLVMALRHSLELAQDIWQQRETKWSEAKSHHAIKSVVWSRLRITAVAASILLLLGGGLVLWLMFGPNKLTDLMKNEPTAAEIRLIVSRAAVTAEMLATADLIGNQPGGEEYARKRYMYLVAIYPKEEVAARAKMKLQLLLERSEKQ